MMPMKTFLQQVAASLLQRYGNNLSSLTVVFPGKRASLFLDQALAEASPTPVWSPSYRTISELFEQASPYTLCDPVEAVCRLYQAYSHHFPSPQNLDMFYSWGEILLADFDDLDKHLVDADQLFANIHDLRELEDNNYLTPEQEEALRAFFSNFSAQDQTELKQRFMQLWEQMPAIYAELGAQMRADGVLYEGALQRDVVTSVDILPHSETTYVFVGFNVLNDVERALFDELQRRHQALFFWDYDTFYVSSKKDSLHEAGYFLRQNLQRYGNELAPEHFNNLLAPKQITFVKASSENAQARYIPQWLKDNLTPQENQTAVVLANEQLLQPVLHSIPDAEMPLNITMGYPLTDTPVHSFLLALLDFQTDGYDATHGRFRYTQLRVVQAHPYAHLIEESIWKRKAGSGAALLTYLTEVIMSLAPSCADDLIAKEAAYITYTRVNRLLDLVSGDEPLLQVNDTTLARVLRKVLQTATIPFHGEPAIGLQVMGILETRALDFSHILMLSVGEGFLPKKASETSMIPYFLREAFGLTTLRHQIAVYAYYFYRLIQRAERITFVYNESNAGTRQNEISRFLRQLLAETDFPIEFLILQTAGSVAPQTVIVKEKTPDVIRQLRTQYDNTGRQPRERHFLSPSAINTYTTCSLKFYYRYIEKMSEVRDPQEGLDAVFFGEIFHRSAELLYTQLTSAGDLVRAQDIDPFLEMEGLRLDPFVRQAFREKFFIDQPEDYRGILYIARRVVATYLVQLLRHDRKLTPFRILGLERQQVKTLHIADMEIDTGGFVDRLDLVADEHVSGGQAIRVVDYKTGGKPDTVTDISRLFAETDQKSHYFFQTILYATIVAEQRGMAVTPCLFFVHKSGAEGYSPKLKLEGQIIHDVRQTWSTEEGDTSLASLFTDRLQQLILDIFDPSIPFTQTEHTETCEICEFRHLCSR